MIHRVTVLALVLLGFLTVRTTSPAVASAQSEPAVPRPATAPERGASAAPSAHVSADACTLLTYADIESVQGEAPTAAQNSERSSAGLVMSQCFYTSKTYVKSVVLEVTRRDPGSRSTPSDAGVATDGSGHESKSAATAGPREQWFRLFHREGKREENAEEEREREREGKSERGIGSEAGREEEEERLSVPKPVKGVGQEAFWVGNGVIGGLYVLKGDAYIRISIGGAETEAARIEKTKTLARSALKRLKKLR